MADPYPQDDGPVAVIVDRVSTYMVSVVAAVRDVLESRGVPLLVHVNDYFAVGVPPSLRHAVESGRVRGLITLPLTTSSAYRDLERLLARHPAVPVVTIGGASGGSSSVSVDNAAGTAEVVRHLLAQEGVERVALVRGVRHHPDSIEREAAVRAVLAEHGVVLDESLVVDGEFVRDHAYRGVCALVEAGRRFDAVVALNDESAAGAVEALLDHGLDVPGDVLVTGFDDVAGLRTRCELTTVSQRLDDVGRCAAELLLELLDGTGTPRSVRLPTRAVLRRSSVRAPLPPGSAGHPPPAPTEDLAPVNATVCLTRGLMTCTTEAEAMRQLAANLHRLQITRCFVVLLEPDEEGEEGPRRGRLELAYPYELPRPAVPFPAVDLLPEHLRGELRHGSLLLQSLAVAGHEIGHVLYEQPRLRLHTAEVLQMDLSLVLDGISRRRGLEQAVNRRTEQLRDEIAVRRRMEEALREEVTERRRTEEALHEANAELRRLLHRDGLTGIANRTAFDATLAEAWQEHRDGGGELSLLLVDVDHFKLYNDTYGHLCGDEALRAVAEVLDVSCRQRVDLAARIGGEEFAVLLPGTTLSGAVSVAGRICRELQRRRIEHRASPVAPHLTVSIGVAGCATVLPADPRDLLEAADAALYAAKAAGRDRTAVAPDDGQEPSTTPLDAVEGSPAGRRVERRLSRRS